MKIQNGVGRVSETITVPVSVVERAFRAGSGTFVYQRVFISGTLPSQTATVNVRITPESIAEFSLRRVELYFGGKDRKVEAIVTRNFKELKAHTDIYFNGSGFPMPVNGSHSTASMRVKARKAMWRSVSTQ